MIELRFLFLIILLEESTIQSLLGIVSKLLLLGECLGEEDEAVLAVEGVDLLLVEFDGAVSVVVVGGVVVLPLQRVVPQQQHVRYYPETEYVAFYSVPPLEVLRIHNYLRSHVPHGPAALE